MIGLEKQNKSHIFIIVLEYNMRQRSLSGAWKARVQNRGNPKQKFKTEEIQSETSAKAWKKKMDDVNFESSNKRE